MSDLTDQESREQYQAAVRATGMESPSRAAVMFEIMRDEGESTLAFINRVNAILAHHGEVAPLPEALLPDGPA